MTDPQTWMRQLSRDLQARRSGLGGLGYDALDRYVSGSQPLGFLQPEVIEQTQGRLQSLSINWARVVIGAVEERLDVEGFRLGGDDSADADLWRIWQANGMDEWSQLGHTDAMGHGRAFGLVWGDDEAPQTPLMSVESASQMTVQYRPGTRRVDAAIKVFRDPDGDPSAAQQAQVGWLYLPDRAIKFEGTSVSGVSSTNWRQVEEHANPLGVVPVVALVNRPQLVNLAGESELVDVIPLIDAINKLATDMMVSSEFHAQPRRWAVGLEIPPGVQAGERFREEVKSRWDDMTKGRTWTAGSGVQFGQFAEATLENFISAMRKLESNIAAIASLPPHYMGISTDNPASADAIRSAEASLVKKAQRKQVVFGGAWEQLMRFAVAIRDGLAYEDLDPSWQQLETQWRDPATPTPAQKADAAVKLTTGDNPIITRNQAREDLGYSPGQIARMVAEESAALDANATADVRARLQLAQTLMDEQSLSQPAAYAAVGLIQAAQQMSPTGPAAA